MQVRVLINKRAQGVRLLQVACGVGAIETGAIDHGGRVAVLRFKIRQMAGGLLPEAGKLVGCALCVGQRLRIERRRDFAVARTAHGGHDECATVALRIGREQVKPVVGQQRLQRRVREVVDVIGHQKVHRVGERVRHDGIQAAAVAQQAVDVAQRSRQVGDVLQREERGDDIERTLPCRRDRVGGPLLGAQEFSQKPT